MKDWYTVAILGCECTPDTRCCDAETNGNCDQCNTINGRWIDAVAEYAQTCDGCGELEMNESLTDDPLTRLGYCDRCVQRRKKQCLYNAVRLENLMVGGNYNNG